MPLVKRWCYLTLICCAVYNDLTQEQNLKFRWLLNTSVRFAHGSIPLQASVTPYRLLLCWFPVENRCLLLLSTLTFTVISSHQPAYHSKLFTLWAQTSPRRVSPCFAPSPLLYSVPPTETLTRFKSLQQNLSTALQNTKFLLTFAQAASNFWYISTWLRVKLKPGVSECGFCRILIVHNIK